MEKVQQWVSLLRDIGLLIGVPILIVVGMELYGLQIKALEKQISMLELEKKSLEKFTFDNAYNLIDSQEKLFLKEKKLVTKSLADLLDNNELQKERLDIVIAKVNEHVKQIEERSLKLESDLIKERENLMSIRNEYDELEGELMEYDELSLAFFDKSKQERDAILKRIKVYFSKGFDGRLLDVERESLNIERGAFDLDKESLKVERRTFELEREILKNKNHVLSMVVEISMKQLDFVSEVVRNCKNNVNFDNCFSFQRKVQMDEYIAKLPNDVLGDNFVSCMVIKVFKDVDSSLKCDEEEFGLLFN